VPALWYVCLERLIQYVNPDVTLCHGRDSKRGFPEHEARVLMSRLRHSINNFALVEKFV
jgi:hypothetical protein